MATLRLTKVALTWYLVRWQEREDQWSRDQVISFLRLHDYTEDDIDRMLSEADAGVEMEIFVPEAPRH